MSTSVRIGADVGGTFTDVVLEHDGEFHSTKLLTTHDAPERAILDGIEQLAKQRNVKLRDVTQIIHGTTLATNALIERRGARTAFVTTAGFRDVIETRTEGRFEQYDLNIVLPTPLIAREDRFVVPERLDANGDILVPFDVAAAKAVIDEIVNGPEPGDAYEAVAVGFLHSYRNPRHERQFRDLLRSVAPDMAVSISSEVSPQIREFERFNTVCANAYVQPLMASYLGRLAEQLAERGATCPLYLIHSGGGLIDVATATAFPVRLVESGPAGGAIFAAHLAGRYGRNKILSYDMGGTTAKIALIEDGVPQTAKTFEVARTTRFKKGSGMPISIPVIEMIEIGAGGGSIASVDSLGQIKVGPHSAGSEPGPASYDRGGDQPTVTDANVQLGRIHPGSFDSSSLQLKPERATEAIESVIGSRLELTAERAAVGILEIVDEDMTNAARVHAVENGKDIAEYSMIAFGGGAPLHAARLMTKLGVTELFVPVGAGVGSAIGFLLAPFSYEAVRSFYTNSAEATTAVDDASTTIDSGATAVGSGGDESGGGAVGFDVVGASTVLAELETEATEFVRAGAGDSVALTVDRQVSMRYRGQGWEIPVRIPDGVFDDVAADALLTEFVKTYERFFGRAIDGLAIEAVSWSVRVATELPEIEPHLIAEPATPIPHDRTRLVYDPVDGAMIDTAIVDRDRLQHGDTVAGPAVIVESQTSTVLGSEMVAVVQGDGALLVTKAGPTENKTTSTDSTANESKSTDSEEVEPAETEKAGGGPKNIGPTATQDVKSARTNAWATESSPTTSTDPEPTERTIDHADSSDDHAIEAGTTVIPVIDPTSPAPRGNGSAGNEATSPDLMEDKSEIDAESSEEPQASVSGNSERVIANQVMWNRLIAIVEEQARTVIRTSFSTSVREAGDLSAGVFDTQGRMIAQAVTGTPGHVNTMAAAVAHFIEDIGRDRIFSGDVYVTNDPWKATGHLNDFTVCTPVFVEDELVGFFASTSHVVDVGGRGYGPDGTELYEEGLRVPIMKWAERGQLNDDLVNIVFNNVREADQVIGDIHGLAASNDTGRRRLIAMMAEFNLTGLDELAEFVFAQTTAAVRAALAAVPAGTYTNTMDVDGYIDINTAAETATTTPTDVSPSPSSALPPSSALAASSTSTPTEVSQFTNSFLAVDVPNASPAPTVDAGDPSTGEPEAETAPALTDAVRLAVTITVDGDGMHADFTGTSPTSGFGINVPIGYAEAYFTYGMMVALAPELPNNHASLAPFTVSAPPGVILNAQAPDPVSVRHVIGHFVTDLCLGALADALPDRIPAEGAGALWNFQASARSADPVDDPRPPVEILMFNSGGSGARPTLDGLTATAFPSGVHTMSTEATEQVGPIIIWRKEIRENSGGAGATRGGDGQIIEVGATDGYRLLFSAMFDRVDHPARGRNGGADGAPGKVYLDDGTPFRTKGKQWIPAERRLIMELPGGGGYGTP